MNPGPKDSTGQPLLKVDIKCQPSTEASFCNCIQGCNLEACAVFADTEAVGGPDAKIDLEGGAEKDVDGPGSTTVDSSGMVEGGIRCCRIFGLDAALEPVEWLGREAAA